MGRLLIQVSMSVRRQPTARLPAPPRRIGAGKSPVLTRRHNVVRLRAVAASTSAMRKICGSTVVPFSSVAPRWAPQRSVRSCPGARLSHRGWVDQGQMTTHSRRQRSMVGGPASRCPELNSDNLSTTGNRSQTCPRCRECPGRVSALAAPPPPPSRAPCRRPVTEEPLLGPPTPPRPQLPPSPAPFSGQGAGHPTWSGPISTPPTLRPLLFCDPPTQVGGRVWDLFTIGPTRATPANSRRAPLGRVVKRVGKIANAAHKSSSDLRVC